MKMTMYKNGYVVVVVRYLIKEHIINEHNNSNISHMIETTGFALSRSYAYGNLV